MQRKLVKQGNNALTVTLPAKWLQEHNLGVGDVVEIDSDDTSLVVRTLKKELRVAQTITLTDFSEFFLERVITNAYKRGVDVLHLQFQADVPIEKINEVLASFTIGYEVTTMEKKKCTIQSFTSEHEEDVDITVRKCFLLIKEMNSLLLEDVVRWKFTRVELMVSYNNNVRKLANYSLRVNVKSTQNMNTLLYQSILFPKLYLYALRIRTIYSFLSTMKKSDKTVIELLNLLTTMFETFYNAYFKHDLTLVKALLDSKDIVTLKLEKNIDATNGRVFLHIHVALRCIHDSIGSLLGIIG